MMTSPPRVSIVTPSLNQGAYLSDAIDSVLSQDYPEIEYIVLDGGSTDGSEAVLRRYEDRLAHLRIGPDSGQTGALIEGFARATGDIAGWLNADDVLEPTAIREAVDTFDADPRRRFVFGDSAWIDAAGRTLQPKREMPFHRWIWLRTYNYIPQPSAFWRRDLYDEVGGLDTSFDLAMDSDLFARFAERTNPVHVPRSWSRMRRHPEQKNLRLRAQSDREDERIRRRYLSRTAGFRWELERAVARAARIAYRAAAGSYLP
jgi:glycosyltransferase involved in cell wall biosynthesis